MEGYLKKWVNFLSGWKNRYFILNNGILSYSEEKGQIAKGTISLKIASITEDPSDQLKIIINSGIDEIQIKTENLAAKFKWLGALRSAQENILLEEEKKNYPDKDIREYEGRLTVDTQYLLKESNMESLKDELAKLWVKQAEFDEIVSLLGPKFENDIEMTRLLEELQELGNEVKYKATECTMNLEVEKKRMVGKMNKIEEKTSYLGSPLRSPLPTHKQDAYYENTGNQGNFLKSSQPGYSNNYNSGPNDYYNNDDNQSDQTVFKSFADDLNDSRIMNAYGDINSNYNNQQDPILRRDDSNQITLKKASASSSSSSEIDPVIKTLITGNPAYTSHPISQEDMRDKLPHAIDPTRKFSILEIVRKMIGQDLSRLAVPVFLNEPLSSIQRVCEFMEHYYLLEKANQHSNPMMRLAYAIAFAISFQYSTMGRTKKPFNPLLGETYEWISEDNGVRFIGEQVSHHPPISAGHCESKDFVWYGDINSHSRFTATALEVTAIGCNHIHLKKNDDHITHNKADISVKNIIFGTIHLEYHGTLEFYNHKTGDNANIILKEKTWTGKNENEVEGELKDKQGNAKYKFHGKWDQELKLTDLATNQVISLWKPLPHPSNFDENYKYSMFARRLNHLNTKMLHYIPRTDSRLRPDQRAYEYGDEDLAASEKHRLEEKQRAVRKQNERTGEQHKVKWFREKTDNLTNQKLYEYTGGYWEAREKKQYGDLLDIYT